jgi:hypothetical protein
VLNSLGWIYNTAITKTSRYTITRIAACFFIKKEKLAVKIKGMYLCSAE